MDDIYDIRFDGADIDILGEILEFYITYWHDVDERKSDTAQTLLDYITNEL